MISRLRPTLVPPENLTRWSTPSALVALESLSRDHPGVVNQVRPKLHSLASADGNEAVRRLAIVCLKNASPQPDTIRLLRGLADDDEQAGH